MLFIEKLVSCKWIFKNIQLFPKFILLGKVFLEESSHASGQCGSHHSQKIDSLAMANMAVCSNSIRSHDSRCQLSLCLSPEVSFLWSGLELTNEHADIESVCGINERQFPNVVFAPVMSCYSFQRISSIYVQLFNSPVFPPPALPLTLKEHGRKT